jgi:phosphomannomutase / phosphoglucomutase
MSSGSAHLNPEIFRAYDIRGIVGVDIVPETAEVIGRAAGSFLQQRESKRIIVGMDNRPSSETLKEALIAGLRSTGCDVIDIGLATSPVLYQAVIETGAAGGIAVTASHNPKEYNGFKIVGQQAFPVAADDMFRLRDVALGGQFLQGAGSLSTFDPMAHYLDKIRSNVHLERRIKLVLDTGNGVGGKFAPPLLKSLGCEVIELYCELDGSFPNHIPNPEHEANVLDLERKVVEAGAEIGLAMDGDGDRLGVIDENGGYRESDYTIILLARDFLSRHPGATVLTDVKSSLNVLDDIRSHGGVPLLYKTGHSLIKQKMRTDNIMLGGEMSGHLYVFENYYPFDDALFAAAKVLEVLSRDRVPFSQHFAGLPKLYATRMIEIPCADAAKFAAIRKLVRLFAEKYEVNEIDGARITFPEGWAVIRASNTTPILTFRAEARTPQDLAAIKQEIYDTLQSFPEIEARAILAATD